MPDTKRHLTLFLTLMGAAPFYLALGAALMGFEPDLARRAFLVYGAVIASFMAGTIWGFGQSAKTPPLGLIVASNIAALLACLSLLLEVTVWSLVLQLLVFLSLLVSDGMLSRAGQIQGWYWKLRISVTCLVALAILLAILIL